ncbi:MAG: purine nucleoside permease, partial [Bryobacteraceae bacterium]
QYWVEREKLDKVYPFPQGYHALRMNKDGVLGMVTGVGTARAAANIMALGLDPRFDLKDAYWIVAGIAGIDPADGSLGSAAWAEWVVDGDLAHEIDAREIPPNWTTGYVPLRKSVPFELPRSPDEGQCYQLNPALVEWAYRLTKDVQLPDTDAMRKRREANDWVKYYTGGKGNFVTTAMEDTGTLQALTFLSHAGLVRRDRVLVLRTASNYDQQRPGISAAESLAETKIGQYSAYLPALESAWRVGHVVVEEIAAHWDRYRAPSH